MKNLAIALIGVIAVSTAIYLFIYSTRTSTLDTSKSTTPSSTSSTQSQNASYTLAQVSQHSTATDCWMVVNNQVYDVTKYTPRHNNQILLGCGQDATAIYQAERKHNGRANNILSSYLIGTLAN